MHLPYQSRIAEQKLIFYLRDLEENIWNMAQAVNKYSTFATLVD